MRLLRPVTIIMAVGGHQGLLGVVRGIRVSLKAVGSVRGVKGHRPIGDPEEVFTDRYCNFIVSYGF